jgi:hypothetical protein
MDGTRPGGLTAMAVLNFVFGGLTTLTSLFALLALAWVQTGGEEVERELERVTEGQIGASDVPWLLALEAAQLAASGLAIASGVGYLKMRRFLGRTLGNAYAVLTLSALVGATAAVGERFQLLHLASAVYPLLTLLLVNVTFKDDLVL